MPTTGCAGITSRPSDGVAVTPDLLLPGCAPPRGEIRLRPIGRILGAKTLGFDLFWSFRSPYSYLATGRIVDLAARYDVEVGVRPVYPIAVRDPEFFRRVNPLWPPYLLCDTARIAERLGIPLRWPRPDPIVQDLTNGEIAKDQPHIHRLTRLGVAAAERGRGLPFIDEVSRIIWSGRVDGWNEGNHLARATERAGLDLRELDGAIEKDSDRYESLIEGNQAAHRATGHWGEANGSFTTDAA